MFVIIDCHNLIFSKSAYIDGQLARFVCLFAFCFLRNEKKTVKG